MEAPIMLLSGHSGEIYASKFHPEGNILASGGFDRQICNHPVFVIDSNILIDGTHLVMFTSFFPH